MPYQVDISAQIAGCYNLPIGQFPLYSALSTFCARKATVKLFWGKILMYSLKNNNAVYKIKVWKGTYITTEQPILKYTF